MIPPLDKKNKCVCERRRGREERREGRITEEGRRQEGGGAECRGKMKKDRQRG